MYILCRLENEHLNNCGKFRAVRDISVAPLDASDQQQIIKMMDDPDPSAQFRKKRILKHQSGSLIDPLKVPLLSDIDKRSDKAAAALKSFHLGKKIQQILSLGILFSLAHKKAFFCLFCLECWLD